ncbi:MFS transporter [Hahella sp. CCB-MM4]|uniref:DHA2 family efflux MFS transporter permease subunit n=1 Tax=Hahella sp. (strain CCB-MM4) TaxID=1926491 RepID=UPI000B9BB942|nr:DHA2 family efflux MFS transporter permease subunit [Hahella sp. CCB-MM4]OZG73992.1 MFS transporter [Hahella sp. CCB-MM4]
MIDAALSALFDRHGPGYRWLAMITVLMGTISTSLTATIINVALPEIMRYFALSQGVAHWLSTGFMAAMTTSMLTAAWLAQRVGLRFSLGVGMLLFCAASALGAFSQSAEILILSRMLQGAAAGLLQPLAIFVLFKVFPREQRGRAIGIYSIGLILAPALGPVLGGIIVDQLDWRYVFIVPIPISFLGLVLSMTYMPGRDQSQTKLQFDWMSFLLLAGGIATGLDALNRLQHGGKEIVTVLLEASISLLLLAGFIWQQHRSRVPLLQLSLLRIASFRSAAIVALALGLARYGSNYLIPLFVQTAYQYSATEAGIMMFPAGIVHGVLFPLAGFAADKYQQRKLIAVGLTVFGVAALLWLGTTPGSPLLYLTLLVVLGRIGQALMMPALSTGALLELDDQHLGQATGMINFCRQFGAAFGINLVAIVLETGGTSAGIQAGAEVSVSSLNYFEAFGMMGTLTLLAIIPALKIGRKTKRSNQDSGC